MITALAWSVPLSLLLLAAPAGAEPCFTAAVVSVHDGDTFDVKRPGGALVTIRLNHIDTPELEARDRHGKLRWPDQPRSREAANALWWLAWGETVRVCPEFKSYGRTGAAVFLRGRDLALPLAEAGWGWVNCRATCPKVREAMERARAARRGLWADPAPCEPAKWRKGGCK